MYSSYFTYNKNKVIQALRYHFISRKEIKVMMVLLNIFAILSAVLFYMKKISPLAFLISSFLWFVMMLMFWFFLPNMIYKRSATFTDKLRVELDEEGMGIENNLGSRKWEWSTFSTWIESPHFFHLYFNSRSFFIIPKEAFAGDDEHEARKLLNRHIARA
ncbi:MAG TPA: hypothetical protein DHV17_10655 [Chitinophagaceae bacterium]|nr:hypothetical protein [Chitinophagaceae bacterium]